MLVCLGVIIDFKVVVVGFLVVVVGFFVVVVGLRVVVVVGFLVVVVSLRVVVFGFAVVVVDIGAGSPFMLNSSPNAVMAAMLLLIKPLNVARFLL